MENDTTHHRAKPLTMPETVSPWPALHYLSLSHPTFFPHGQPQIRELFLRATQRNLFPGAVIKPSTIFLTLSCWGNEDAHCRGPCFTPKKKNFYQRKDKENFTTSLQLAVRLTHISSMFSHISVLLEPDISHRFTMSSIWRLPCCS